MLEEWSQQPLELSAVYGVREYGSGSTLRSNVDKLGKHLISAVLQIDQVTLITLNKSNRSHSPRSLT